MKVFEETDVVILKSVQGDTTNLSRMIRTSIKAYAEQKWIVADLQTNVCRIDHIDLAVVIVTVVYGRGMLAC